MIKYITYLLFLLPTIVFAQNISEINEIQMQGTVNVTQDINIESALSNKYFSPYYIQKQIALKNNLMIFQEPLNTSNGKDVLYPNEFTAFEVDLQSKQISYIKPNYALNQKCYSALAIVPSWIEDQLILKFRELKLIGLDDDYAQIILDAASIDTKIVDEVAFTIANLAATSLNNSRFKADKEYIIRNAQFIYNVDDSLKYVEIIEHGDYATRDYYTTTKYRIADGQNGTISWEEIPYEYYYWYIVHPKLNAEGVWVQDQTSDQQQRTWGYSWQDYIWSNPDPTHDYTKVNLTSSLGTVSTIPRFGEMMQGPEVLWNRNKNYYLFGRSLSTYDHALDLLANWASQAIPADPIANQARAISPNQILYYHRGRCGEDSYLMTAACKTALIPVICRGTQREDHVFDAFWDKDWNHYEFFRGGLASNGWGWTNLLNLGGYEELSPDYWVISFVHGYRPDGYIFNHTPYYTDVCHLKLRLVDNNDKPLDGVQVRLFARPGHNSDPNDNAVAYSGQGFTDAFGTAEFDVGDRKVYYYQLYHPSFGFLPAETQVYYFTTNNVLTTKDRIYDIGTVKIPVDIKSLNSQSSSAPANSEFGVHLKWTANEIKTGINDLDFQKSKFYFWEKEQGSVSFFVCDETNYNLFKQGSQFSAYESYNYTESGDVYIALPEGNKWFVVLSNTQSYNNYQFVSASCDLLEDVQTSIEVEQDPKTDVEVHQYQSSDFAIYPNPVTDKASLELNADINQVDVFDAMGNLIETINYPFIWKPKADLANGFYFFKSNYEEKVFMTKALLMR